MKRRKFITTLSGVTALLAVGPSVLAAKEPVEVYFYLYEKERGVTPVYMGLDGLRPDLCTHFIMSSGREFIVAAKTEFKTKPVVIYHLVSPKDWHSGFYYKEDNWWPRDELRRNKSVTSPDKRWMLEYARKIWEVGLNKG